MRVRPTLEIVVSLLLLATGLAAQAAGRGAQTGGAAQPAQTTPAPPPRLPAEAHPDISGIWNRVDTVGAGSWGGLAATFPRAELTPDYAAKLPPEQFVGVGTPPAGFVPPTYDINAQAPVATRCAVGGGGFNAGGGNINID